MTVAPGTFIDGAAHVRRVSIDDATVKVREGDRKTPSSKSVDSWPAFVVDGVDIFLEAVRPLLAGRDMAFRYEEIDPDVFGEELMRAPYDGADRIAAVLLVADAPNQGAS